MKKIAIIYAATFMLGISSYGPNALAKDVQYDLRVDGMTCPFCAATSEKAIKKIKGVRVVSTNLKKATISVCATEETDMADSMLTKILMKKGFTYVSKTKKQQCSVQADNTDVKTGFWKSIFHKHS